MEMQPHILVTFVKDIDKETLDEFIQKYDAVRAFPNAYSKTNAFIQAHMRTYRIIGSEDCLKELYSQLSIEYPIQWLGKNFYIPPP